MSDFYNTGSIILGLIAWFIPACAIKKYNKDTIKNTYLFTVISFLFCGASLCFQLLEINRRVVIQDWSALMDTCRAISIVAIVLVVITAIINVVVLSICNEK